MPISPVRRVALFVASVAFAWTGAAVAEVPVDQPRYRPAPRSQSAAVVASNGDQYLVLWNDERADAPQKHVMRISRDGVALDPNGIRVRSRSRKPGHMVWAGEAWFVLSEGEYNEERRDQEGPELIRIDRNGNVLDAVPLVLPVHPKTGITVATDGRHVVVGYDRELYEKRALIVDGNGAAVADFRLSPPGAASMSGPPAIGSNGSVFAALWVNGATASDGAQAIEGVRFGISGTLGPVRTVFGSFSRSTPAMASDGRDFVVIQDRGVYRMTADLAVEFLFGSSTEFAQAVVWTGSAYAVVLRTSGDAREVKIVRLDPASQILGEHTTRLEGTAAQISSRAAASNGESLLLAWHDATEEPATTIEKLTDVYAAMVPLPELAPGPRKLLSVSAIRQSGPAMASGAGQHVTVWQDPTGLYARRHRRNGAADGPPLRLSGGAGSAAVVFNGADFIVASTEGRMVVTRRLPAAGELRVEGESRIGGGSVPRHVALAASGGVTLVAWFDNYGYNHHGGTVYLARAGADGAFLEEEPLELAPLELAWTVHKLAVAASGHGEFLVVWGGSNPDCVCSPPAAATSDVLRAARVTPSLTVLDAHPIEVVVTVGPYDDEGWPHEHLYDPEHSLYADHPAAAWNGKEWLVVWNRGYRVATGEDDDDFAEQEEIRGRRIARDGTLLDGPATDPGVLIAHGGFAPAVAWTGAAWRLAWYEGRPNHRDRMNLLGYPLLRMRTASFHVLGGPLSDIRTIGEAKWAEPVAFSVADGVVSSAYARIADEPQFGGILRVFLDLPAPPVSRRRGVRN